MKQLCVFVASAIVIVLAAAHVRSAGPTVSSSACSGSLRNQTSASAPGQQLEALRQERGRELQAKQKELEDVVRQLAKDTLPQADRERLSQDESRRRAELQQLTTQAQTEFQATQSAREYRASLAAHADPRGYREARRRRRGPQRRHHRLGGARHGYDKRSRAAVECCAAIADERSGESPLVEAAIAFAAWSAVILRRQFPGPTWSVTPTGERCSGFRSRALPSKRSISSSTAAVCPVRLRLGARIPVPRASLARRRAGFRHCSFAVEWSQLYSHSRFPSVQDVLCNACGALIGGWLAARGRSMKSTMLLVDDDADGIGVEGEARPGLEK